jgi:hypothetical protein
VSLQIGRVILGEADLRPFEETWSSDGRSVTIAGIVHTGQGQTVAGLSSLHDDILGLPESLVACTFGTKSHRNGFYTVAASKSSLIHLAGEQVIRIEWEISLRREGSMSEVDLETRLAGPLTRANDHTLTGVRWTAPPVLHSAFWAGANAPGVVNRFSEEGTVKVYTGLPIGQASVRWACDPLTYDLGAARVLDDDNERSGTGISLSPNGWELNNALVGLQWDTDSFRFYYFDGVDWKSYKAGIWVDSVAPGIPHAVSVLYNQPERVTLRLVWVASDVRVTADVTLRRGARYVEVVMKKPVSSTMAAGPWAATVGAASGGVLRPTAANADGDRILFGSARTFSSNTTTGVLSKNATTRLDFMLGVELESAGAGDTAAALMQQYLGGPSETIVAVRR